MTRRIMTIVALLTAAVLGMYSAGAAQCAVCETAVCETGLYRISGRVLKNGIGIGGILIDGGALGQMTTAADGSFTFCVIPNANFSIKPVASSCLFAPQYRAGTIVGDHLTANFLVESGICSLPVHSVSGRVTRNGSGAGGVVITRSGSSDQTMTDEAGNYTLCNVPDGIFTITASKAGLEFIPGSRTIEVRGADLTGVDFSASMRGDEACRTQSYSSRKNSLNSDLAKLKSAGLASANALSELKSATARRAARSGRRKISSLYDSAAYYVGTVPGTVLVCPADINVCTFETTGTDIAALRKAGRSLYASVRRLAVRYCFLAKKRRPELSAWKVRTLYLNFRAGVDGLPATISVCR